MVACTENRGEGLAIWALFKSVSQGGLILLAFRAQAVELEQMAANAEAETLLQFLFHAFGNALFKLDDCAAGRADEMMVAAFSANIGVALLAKIDGADNAELG
jgi:hypothetical protein